LDEERQSPPIYGEWSLRNCGWERCCCHCCFLLLLLLVLVLAYHGAECRQEQRCSGWERIGTGIADPTGRERDGRLESVG
jgi:hypothetical protein